MTDTSQAVTLNPNEIRYLNDKEVSKITGKAIATLRNERSLRKGIPYIKAGGKILYSLQDIVKYMNDHRVNTEQ